MVPVVSTDEVEAPESHGLLVPRNGFLDISDAPADIEVVPRSQRSLRIPKLVAVLQPTLVAILGACAAVVWLGRREGWVSFRSAESLVVKFEQSSAPSQCGRFDYDTNYVEYSGWGKGLDHIPTPEMCCAFCQGEPRCKSWVWVRDAGLSGCPSQCWLKGGTPVKKEEKAGLISGIPPRRATFYPPQSSRPDPKKSGAAGVFCFSLMVPFGYEPQLLAWQYRNGVSIFGCDGFAVYSNTTVQLAPNLVSRVVDSNLHCDYGGDSNSALNAWIFMAVWRQVIIDGDYLNFPWTVKVDPDAVFFPNRLRPLLREHQGSGYINNCKYGMHGPIEVLERRAVDALAEDYSKSWDGKAPKRCATEQHFGQYGEDMFMDQCLSNILKVTGGKPIPLDSRLMCEGPCDCEQYYWCKNGTDRVSFHPFKSVESYKNCLANAEQVGSIA